ncbi:MAG: molybdenum cofactor guanylyltransferase [Actinomycetota bacterium]|nr:molybdenum cofactor guanylyltransferase [Actinomycetota bacterium]
MGIVLAGGRSRRFGRDKLVEEYEGRPLLQHPVSRLLEVCDRVVVVLAPDAPEPSMPAGASVEFARDAIEDEGPLRGLSAGLDFANAEWVVLAGGDMPDLQRAVLLEMLRAGAETGVVAVSLSDGGKERPLPCVLRTVPAAEAVGALLEAGRRGLRDLLAAVTSAVVDEPTWTSLDPERRTLFDVDEPADLDR